MPSNLNLNSFLSAVESLADDLLPSHPSTQSAVEATGTEPTQDYYTTVSSEPEQSHVSGGGGSLSLLFSMFTIMACSPTKETKYEPVCADVDGDGTADSSCGGTDCNDNDASVYPGATETCNGVDDNCNGTVDDNPVDPSTFYADTDGDSYGNLSSPTTACTLPAGYVVDSTDCKDEDATIHPGATETCNGVDDNCDGQIDEGLSLNTYYQDADGDTYGNPNQTLISCTQPDGYVTDNRDCDDTNPEVNPAMVIQDAVNAASDGDVVYVCDGTYDENVTISDKAITLIGESTDAIINGNGINTIIVTGTSNAVIENLTITGGDEWGGVVIEPSPSGSTLSVEGCIVTNNTIGIIGSGGNFDFSSGFYSLTIDNTEVSNNGVGIEFDDGFLTGGTLLDAVIRNSTVTGNQSGMWIYQQEGESSVSIEDSTIDSNGIPAIETFGGGGVGPSSSIIISGGSISNNSYLYGDISDGASAIALTPWNGTLTITDGTLISGNESDHEGLFQMIGDSDFSSHMTIENATISDNVSANGDEIVHLETLDGDDFFESDVGAVWSGNSPNTIYFQGFGIYYYDIASFGASFVCSSTGCE